MITPLEVIAASDVSANQRDEGTEFGSESLQDVAADRGDLAVGYRWTIQSEAFVVTPDDPLIRSAPMTGDVVLAVRILEYGTLRDRIPMFIFGSIDLGLRKTWNDGRSNVSNVENMKEETRTHETLCRVTVEEIDGDVLAVRVLEQETDGVPSPRCGSIALNMHRT